MVPAATALATTAATSAPIRRRLRADGRGDGQVDPAATGAGFEFTPILKPLEPFREQVVVVTGTTPVGRHALAQCRGLPVRLAPKRTEAEDVRRRDDHRSDHRRADRRGHTVRVARDWRSRTSPGTSAPATPATAAPIRTRCRGRRRRCRCRWRPTRAWCSSGCSAGPARPLSAARALDSTPASSIRCARCADLNRGLGPRDKVRLTRVSRQHARIERRIQTRGAAGRAERPDAAGDAGRHSRGITPSMPA